MEDLDSDRLCTTTRLEAFVHNEWLRRSAYAIKLQLLLGAVTYLPSVENL